MRQAVELLWTRIVHHTLVQGIASGRLPRERLKILAEQEYQYTLHIYDYFALGILQAPDREGKAFFLEMVHREAGYHEGRGSSEEKTTKRKGSGGGART